VPDFFGRGPESATRALARSAKKWEARGAERASGIRHRAPASNFRACTEADAVPIGGYGRVTVPPLRFLKPEARSP
jgi:hypothetical protein